MITFLAPMFKEEWEPYMFIGSLMCQTDDRWKAVIYMNGDLTEKRLELIDFIEKNKISHKIEVLYSERNTHFWGCYNRKAFLEIVNTEYLINTSVQDYLFPTLVAEILKEQKDLIYWNSINHIFGYDKVLLSSPEIGRIDWGNFALRSSIAKQVGINKPEEFCADGLFITDVMKSGLVKTTRKINSILTVHN